MYDVWGLEEKKSLSIESFPEWINAIESMQSQWISWFFLGGGVEINQSIIKFIWESTRTINIIKEKETAKHNQILRFSINKYIFRKPKVERIPGSVFLEKERHKYQWNITQIPEVDKPV